MFAVLKVIRMIIVGFLVVALASCTQTTGNMTKAERRKAEAQNRAVGQLIAGAAIVGAAVVLGASASGGHTYYHRAPRGSRGHNYRGGNNCGVQYWTPNPGSPNC